MSEQYQNCIITLDDGSIHVFTGRVMSEEGETRKITDISFSKPQDLPDGSYFEGEKSGGVQLEAILEKRSKKTQLSVSSKKRSTEVSSSTKTQKLA